MRGRQIMDEIGLIRRQHELEHAHLSEAVKALADLEISDDINAIITSAYKSYIIDYIRRSLSRCDAMMQQLMRNLALTSEERASLETVSQLSRASAARLTELEQTSGAARAALEPLNRMRALLTPLAERHFTLSDWRCSARFDANSMLDEKTRFAKLRALRRERTATARS